jgi:hypothetical protein
LAGPLEFLHQLKAEGQLPGWAKDEHGTMSMPESNGNSVTFTIIKKTESSLYHYTVSRTSKDGPWKLQKAWRTDQNGHTIEEYPFRAFKEKL